MMRIFEEDRQVQSRKWAFRWHEQHVQRPQGKDKYDGEEIEECWYGWNRKREKKNDKMKQVDQVMGLHSIFSAI